MRKAPRRGRKGRTGVGPQGGKKSRRRKRRRQEGMVTGHARGPRGTCGASQMPRSPCVGLPPASHSPIHFVESQQENSSTSFCGQKGTPRMPPSSIWPYLSKGALPCSTSCRLCPLVAWVAITTRLAGFLGWDGIRSTAQKVKVRALWSPVLSHRVPCVVSVLLSPPFSFSLFFSSGGK